LLDKILNASRIGDRPSRRRDHRALATDPTFAETNGGFFGQGTLPPLPCPEPDRRNRIQDDLWETTALPCSTGVVFSEVGSKVFGLSAGGPGKLAKGLLHHRRQQCGGWLRQRT